MSLDFKFWAIIPAAGSSRRMGDSALPKQYLKLLDRSVLEWALAPFLARPDCAGIVVVLAADDKYWHSLDVARESRIHTAVGGNERSASVHQGLLALKHRAAQDDWVLVHDAARPCLDTRDLSALIETLRTDEVGGLLASPLVDTLKRADDADRVAGTVSRTGLWRALTPQMFRYGLLDRALTATVQQKVDVTDESQAIELLNLRPKLVRGSTQNIKITLPEDLSRAQSILRTMDQR